MRDLTKAQFNKRLLERGFEQSTLWFTHRDNPNSMIGGIYDKHWNLRRRATLSKIIKHHNAEMAKKRASS